MFYFAPFYDGRRGQYMLLPLYVWNMAFVLVTCAMSPWVFNTRIFWAVLLPTSFLLGVSVLAEILMTGVRVRVCTKQGLMERDVEERGRGRYGDFDWSKCRVL